MSSRSAARVVALVALAAFVLVPLTGCGGGGQAGTPDDHDLIVTYFNMKGRTDVYRNQELELTFSAPVAADSINDRTIRVLTGPNLLTPVNGALIQVDGNKIVYDVTRSQAEVERLGSDVPRDQPFGFTALANHQIYIPGPPLLKTLKNRAGDPIREEFFASFRTGEDYVPELDQPSYIGTDGKGALGFDPGQRPDGIFDPVVGPTEIPFDSHIILVFDEPIAPESMDPSKSVIVENLDEDDPNRGGFNPLPVPGTLRPSQDGKTYTFVPSFGYGPGPYRMRVQLTQDITDLAGNPLENPITRYFQTEYAPGEQLIVPIIETFDNILYRDPIETNAEWGSVAPGRLQGGAITQTTVTVMYTASPPNSNRGGAGTAAFGPVDYPLVSEQGNQACPAWPTGCRLQVSYTASDIGEPGAITEVFWGPSSNALFAATHSNIKIRLGHTKSTEGVIAGYFEENFENGLPLPQYDGLYDIPQRADVDPQNPQGGFWPYPELTSPFEFNGTNGLLIGFQVQPAADCQLLRYWFHGTGAAFPGYPGIRNIIAKEWDADADDVTGGGQPLVFDMEFIKKRRTTKAQSKFYDTERTAPDFATPVLSPSSQPGGASFKMEWQGADDPDDDQTYTPWSGTIDIADGKRYIRFRVDMISNLNSNTVARFDEIRIPFISE